MNSSRPFAVIILAAGGGTRMKSGTPKVLHHVAGRSLVGHVIVAARELQPEHLVVVVGHGRELVEEHLHSVAPDVEITVQAEQNGTGHAVRVTLEQLAERGISPQPDAGPILVLTGDTPLLTGSTLVDLVAGFADSQAATTLLSAELADPTGYGRVLRNGTGDVIAIVEHKDADEEALAISEINCGMYAFAANLLPQYLAQLDTNNVQGEEYLTDVIGLACAESQKVTAVTVADPREILGVNDRVQLAEAASILQQRINEQWLRAGVSMPDPKTVYIDSDVILNPDVRVEPNTHLKGTTEIATGATVGPDTTLVDTEVGEGAHVRRTEAHLAVIGAGAEVGPFTYLRPGTILGANGKIGGFCEVKNAEIGEGSKVPHLSYVGDATIGSGTNIGAATVFVNYDGVQKHHTVVGDNVRVGSDTMLVAPVTLGDGCYTGAGSVITQDVPPGALALARGQQRNLEGWVGKKRPGTASAASAAQQND